MPTCENFSYMMLNLMGEVGEFASKVAKAVRKGQVYIGDSLTPKVGGTNHINYAPMDNSEIPEFDDALMYEAGDILWQLSGLCDVMGWELEEVAQANLDKLASRKTRGVIDGNGDNR